MSDINKRGAGCGIDRGGRGNRGPRGPEGPPGPAGVFSAAYGYAVSTGTQTLDNGVPVQFSMGDVFPSVDITPPIANGTSFTILSAGDYEYVFHVLCQPDDTNPVSSDFGLRVNAIAQGAGHTFRSNRGGTTPLLLVQGEGIIFLEEGDVVTLVNEGIKSALPNTAPSNNATLSLKKLS